MLYTFLKKNSLECRCSMDLGHAALMSKFGEFEGRIKCSLWDKKRLHQPFKNLKKCFDTKLKVELF